MARRTPARLVVGGDPETLEQAEDMLRRQKPAITASADEWRAFHEHSARVFHAVADVDADHHFEALALASIARDDATKVSGAVSTGKPG